MCLVFLALCGYGSAQMSTDSIVVVGNLEVRARITIASATVPGGLVSGTKVEVVPACSAGLAVSGPGTYDNALCYRARVSIGGTQIYDEIYFDPSTAGGGGGTGLTEGVMEGDSVEGGPIGGLPEFPQLADIRSVRFASTHFADGSTVPVSIELTYALYRFGVHIASSMVTASANLVAYNKGLVLATNEEFSDDPSTPEVVHDYWVPQTLLPNGYATASQNAMPEAKAKLASMNHTLLNPQGEALLREAELSPLLKQATAFFGFTHGEPTNFRAAEIDSLVFQYPGSEVEGYVKTGRSAPQVLPDVGMNLVVMHACSTTGGQGNTQYHSGSAFGVAKIPGTTPVIPGRAYAGFSTVVWSLTYNQWPLDEHAKRVYQSLSSGATINAAVNNANQAFLPMNGSNQALRMVVRGDLYARSVGVYTGSSNASPNGWYLVL